MNNEHMNNRAHEQSSIRAFEHSSTRAHDSLFCPDPHIQIELFNDDGVEHE